MRRTVPLTCAAFSSGVHMPTIVLLSIALLLLLALASALHSVASLVRFILVVVIVCVTLSYGLTLYAHASDYHARAAARLADIERASR